MAVINAGSIVSDIRGSVGTETYSRNQGGLIVRNRTVPVDNNTAGQQACRAAFTALSQYWSGTLTEQQRADWRSFARQHPQTNQWGQPTLVNGYTRFIQINATRYRLDTAVAFDDPPPVPHLHPPVVTITADASADTVTIALPPGLYTPPFTNLEIFAFGGDSVSAGVNYYSGPWRYVDRNKFDGTWTTDPWIIAYPLDLVAADKVFLKAIAQHATQGQLSRPFQTSCVIAP